VDVWSDVGQGKIRISLGNDLAEIPKLGQELTEFGQRSGFAARTLLELKLAVEEVLTNVVSHAYPDGCPRAILVTALVEGGALIVEVEDDGRPFDPLGFPRREPPASVDQAAVGGVGIQLVRSLTDAIEYRRIGDRNRLTLVKRDRPGKPGGPG
jgi:anti-sigma regulatory factor (Ser/Thr protein kinase)